ncbi:MAG: agmatinase [Porticoccaceae bacterium]|nr:MAG: agmatinase [Porticoccaceae bacterium]
MTTSYGGGASLGPEAIRAASPQLDFHLRGMADHLARGWFMLEPDPEISALNAHHLEAARVIQTVLAEEGDLAAYPDLEARRAEINRASERVNQRVYEQAKALLAEGKFAAVVGGDHSSPLGLMRAVSERLEGDYGVLHLDAHHDLRPAYQGFVHSHASIMYNALELPFPPRALVQVGVRDYCREEAELAARHPAVHPFYDEDLKAALFRGRPFAELVAEILAPLPRQVYVSFDIDGLDPSLCPHTGTPVPGGLRFEEAAFLLRALVESGRRIVAFDLCEVAPDPRDPERQWDGNVGARVLFQLSSWLFESQLRAGGAL